MSSPLTKKSKGVDLLMNAAVATNADNLHLLSSVASNKHSELASNLKRLLTEKRALDKQIAQLSYQAAVLKEKMKSSPSKAKEVESIEKLIDELTEQTHVKHFAIKHEKSRTSGLKGGKRTLRKKTTWKKTGKK